jgi:hypothetical protein
MYYPVYYVNLSCMIRKFSGWKSYQDLFIHLKKQTKLFENGTHE